MFALVLALLSFCPLLSGGVMANVPVRSSDFSFMGASDWIVYITNPTPFSFTTHEVELVLKDADGADSFRGNRVEIPATTVAANQHAQVHFRDDALDMRRIAGSLIICDGIKN